MKQTFAYLGIIAVAILVGVGAKEIYLFRKEQQFIELQKEIVNQRDSIDLVVQLDSLSTEQITDTSSNSSTRSDVPRQNGLYQKPFYIISVAAVGEKKAAMDWAVNISEDNLLGNFLWIPDYQEGGKRLYKVFIGPFKTKIEALQIKDKIENAYPGCYVQTVK